MEKKEPQFDPLRECGYLPLPTPSLLDEIIEKTEAQRALAQAIEDANLAYPVSTPSGRSFGALPPNAIITCRLDDLHRAYPVTYPCPSTFGAALVAA